MNRFIRILNNASGAVSLEIAFVFPILLVLVMGILEFSVIFSMRAGIEEVSRTVARIKLSVSGSEALGNKANQDKVLSDLLGERLVDIVFVPKNARICSSHYRTIGQLLTNASIDNNCRTADKISNGQGLRMGNSGDYIRVNIDYTHEYLTPLGGLIETLGSDISFNSVTYFRKEVE